ncbi:Rieske (2Fe-2S) iron-sulfur domain protein [Hydrogenobacter thermophilus TK-6]|uniref:Nitrogen-fixing NifU-like protein n=1 Tax=Hydrogenobacter thermophilus (strain DSM 6534 / IAM 12695 / TK-6) TaxID=608538 RepID=D3DGG3_HYDTT|nr:NifU family protein [Hydrogenobacter thermophilus]ADO44850.1 Rieske (2Fe-2S) iron-sulfur domain protein [Hydrogenobacter thermophilus TK-6]BAI68915.1 nitrogen-fixing NifU-like protein [Hydrogenobacter thermophilus TK-6]
MTEELSFEKLAERIDELLAKVKNFEDEKRETVGELIKSIEEFTRMALVKLVKLMKEDSAGKDILLKAVREPEIYSLFLKHGIIREDDRTKAIKALELIRPYIRSHGGDVEFVDLKEKTLYVRLRGTCTGCSQVSFTLQQTILEAVQAYIPHIEKVELAKDTPVEAFLELSGKEEGYIKAFDISELKEGHVYRFLHEGVDVILMLWKGRVYAYRNSCAHQGHPLHEGELTEKGVLVCPWHRFEYSITSGECLTVPYVQLVSVPTKIQNGWVLLKVR